MVAFFMIIYVSFYINRSTDKEITKTWGPVKRHFIYADYLDWNIASLPMFICGMTNLFEGNQCILNIYAEVDVPEKFFDIVSTMYLIVVMIFAIILGYVGYITFGIEVSSFIIFDLPLKSAICIAIKALFVLTIAGNFVIVAQPIFQVVESMPFYKNFL